MPTGRRGRLWALILMPVALARVHLLVASGAISSADAQSRIEELGASVDATVSSTEGLPAEVRGGYLGIGLRYVPPSYGSRTKENPVAA
jgi:hypothetical protein